jgi:hypothetical protein
VTVPQPSPGDRVSETITLRPPPRLLTLRVSSWLHARRR